jgi:hypothetical protein
MKRIIKKALCGTFVTFVMVTVWLNAKLYFPPTTQPNFQKAPPNAVTHLAFLKKELTDGAALKMQEVFPEGFFFSHVLYGLTWVELGLRSAEHRDEAVREARRALAEIDSAEGKAAFPSDLPPEHGMFYSGWRNHLQAGIILLEKDEAEILQLRARCDALVQALTDAPTWPWLASYHNQVWPCDTPPGIHALCVYDQVSGGNRYAEFVTKWISAVRGNLCPTHGMITHMADPATGEPLGTPRGTSQVIILRFLAEIDPEFASEQYTRFQAHFIGNLLGAPAVLEYPRGIAGPSDVDSGPLIAGVSTSATVVAMGVAQIYGDEELSKSISQVGETIGFPFGNQKRCYLGGILPIGDAFVVHATSARPWLHNEIGVTILKTPISKWWRLRIHILSIFACIIPVLSWLLIHIARIKRSKR